MPKHQQAILIIIGTVLVFGASAFWYFNSGTRDSWKQVSEERGRDVSQSTGQPVNFSEYFSKREINGVPLRQKTIGHLQVRSGEIVACDPIYAGEEFTLPFTATVAPGSYPVILCFTNLKDWGERVAFAQLVLKEDKPVHFEMACTAAVNPDDYFYVVDAGLGCFADRESAALLGKAMVEHETKNPEGNYYSDILEPEFAGHEDWNIHYPLKDENHNVIMFTSGIGDGAYASYWGYNAKGEAVCLITDFQLFDDKGNPAEATE